MTPEEKIKSVPNLENWELVRDFEIESLNMQYYSEQRNRIICDKSSPVTKIEKAQNRLNKQIEVMSAYKTEILKRMK